MFELGLDQAHGLKRLFVPLTDGRINVIGVCPEADIAIAVIGIGKALVSKGFDIQWKAPRGLLPSSVMNAGDSDGAQIVIAAWREGTSAVDDDHPPDHSIFVSNPHPDQLPDLYAALKATANDSDSYADGKPFTVMWCGPDQHDHRLRSICENNLSEAVNRFLLAEVEFVNADREAVSSGYESQSPAGTYAGSFIERLSASLLCKLGQTNQLTTATVN